MPEASADNGLLLHASCVALQDQAVLITGASARGKSTLALELMAYGCTLVSDDQTWIANGKNGLIAHAPNTIRNRIEARGLGIITAQSTAADAIVMAIDLDQTEQERIPPRRGITYLGVTIPLYYVTPHPAFAAAVLQLLKAGGKRHGET